MFFFTIDNSKAICNWQIRRLLQAGSALLLMMGLLTVGQPAFAGWEPDKLSNAKQAISEFKKADPSLKRFFNSAYAYAVFPTVGKGGIGIGGAYGSGTVFIGANLWVRPASRN